jgi:hypothetical protein
MSAVRFALLLVVGLMFIGCGCNDIEYRFHVSPTPLVEVRAKTAADQVVFDGQVPLVIDTIKNAPDACESECVEGRGSLGTTG